MLVYVCAVWSSAYGEIVPRLRPVKIIDEGLPGPALFAQVVLEVPRPLPAGAPVCDLSSPGR